MDLDQPHLPEQVPIDAYGDGGFRFAGMRRRGSLLCLPIGLFPWRPATLDEVKRDDLALIVESKNPPPFLLFGLGSTLVAVPDVLRIAVADANIALEPMDTGAACRTYNVLLAEGRPVAAALLQVP